VAARAAGRNRPQGTARVRPGNSLPTGGVLKYRGTTSDWCYRKQAVKAGHDTGGTTRSRSGKGNDMIESIAIGNAVCAIVCAKWALELGYSQTRQVLFLIGGLLFGPLTLLILYVYHVDKATKERRTGAKFI
jgi:hypothetical protein